MDNCCYEDIYQDRKYWCEKRLAGSGCCYNNPGVERKTWENCPFGKLHKHYQVDLKAEADRLFRARAIRAAVLNEIVPLLEYNTTPTSLIQQIQDLPLTEKIEEIL